MWLTAGVSDLDQICRTERRYSPVSFEALGQCPAYLTVVNAPTYLTDQLLRACVDIFLCSLSGRKAHQGAEE